MEVGNMERVIDYPTLHSEKLNKIEDLEIKLNKAKDILSEVTIVVKRASNNVELLDSGNPLAKLFQDLLHIINLDMNQSDSEFRSRYSSSQGDPLSPQSMESVEINMIQPSILSEEDQSQHLDLSCKDLKEDLENKGERKSPKVIVGYQCGVGGCRRRVLFSRHITPSRALVRLRHHFVVGHTWLKVDKFTYIELTEENELVSPSITSINSSSIPSISSSSSETSTVRRESSKKTRVCYKCDKNLRRRGHVDIPHLYNCYSWNCNLDFITAVELAKHRDEVHGESRSEVKTPLIETEETFQQQSLLDMDMILVLTDIPEEGDNIEDDFHFSEVVDDPCDSSIKDQINQEQENSGEEKDNNQVAVLDDLNLAEEKMLVQTDIPEEGNKIEDDCHFSESVDGPCDTSTDQFINHENEKSGEGESYNAQVVELDDLTLAVDKHIFCRNGISPVQLQHLELNSIEGQEENMIEDEYEQYLSNEGVHLFRNVIILESVNQVHNELYVNESSCIQKCYVKDKLTTEDESSFVRREDGPNDDVIEDEEEHFLESIENDKKIEHKSLKCQGAGNTENVPFYSTCLDNINGIKEPKEINHCNRAELKTGVEASYLTRSKNKMETESVKNMINDDESLENNLVVQPVHYQDHSLVNRGGKGREKRRVLDIWLLSGSRLKRCNFCKGCKVTDCGSCFSCRDMKKFGGAGSHRQACKQRVCYKLEEARAERRRLKEGEGRSEACKQRVSSLLMEDRTERRLSKVGLVGRREACQQRVCSKLREARPERKQLKVGVKDRNGNTIGYSKILRDIKQRQGKLLKDQVRHSSRLCNTDVLSKIEEEVLGPGHHVSPRKKAILSLMNVNSTSRRRSHNYKRRVIVNVVTDCEVLLVEDINNKE